MRGGHSAPADPTVREAIKRWATTILTPASSEAALHVPLQPSAAVQLASLADAQSQALQPGSQHADSAASAKDCDSSSTHAGAGAGAGSEHAASERKISRSGASLIAWLHDKQLRMPGETIWLRDVAAGTELSQDEVAAELNTLELSNWLTGGKSQPAVTPVLADLQKLLETMKPVATVSSSQTTAGSQPERQTRVGRTVKTQHRGLSQDYLSIAGD